MVAVVCLVYTYVCLLLSGGRHNVATYYSFDQLVILRQTYPRIGARRSKR